MRFNSIAEVYFVLIFLTENTLFQMWQRCLKGRVQALFATVFFGTLNRSLKFSSPDCQKYHLNTRNLLFKNTGKYLPSENALKNQKPEKF